MICISVTPTSRQLAKVDILNAARNADLVEVCLDHLAKEPDIPDLLAGIGKPILFSCRRKEEGGQWDGTEEQRLALLRQAIVAGPAYIELELDIARSIPRFGKTKRVISITRMDKALGNVEELIDEARTVNADVVKFTWPTPTLDAAWPLLAAVSKKRDIPAVGFGIGKGGVTFSLLGQKYGSPWMYAALEKGMEAFEGQSTVFDLDEIYAWRQIDTHTRFVGVVGLDAWGSTTTRLFTAAFKKLGLNMRCLPLSLAGFDRLGQMLDILKINALLVSPRFAEPLMAFAQDGEEAAKESRYCDILVKQPAGWTAYNTAWKAVLKSVEDKLGRKGPEDRPLDRRNVLVIGTSGLAPATAWGIQRRKGVLSVTGPDDKAAQALAGKLSCRYVPFASLYDTLADVVVIADPAIIAGHKKTELNPAYLRPHMLVADVSHLPDDTTFLSEARMRNCKVIEPKAVYRDQMAGLFKSLTGQEMPVDVLDAGLAETAE